MISLQRHQLSPQGTSGYGASAPEKSSLREISTPNGAVSGNVLEPSPAQIIREQPLRAGQSGAMVQPAISVIIINYNGGPWLERCLKSLRAQTIFDDLEIIVADNASPDQSSTQAAAIMRDWPLASVLQYKTNFGYAGGNNRAAELARGHYLFFLNNDTWLEPDCLEKLLQEMHDSDALAATPLVMDYTDDRLQWWGASGFDVFGLLSWPREQFHSREIFVACGPAVLIEKDLFQRLGQFDDKFFMYAEEYDICWKAWLAGARVILAASARLHHRGAPDVNPSGNEKILETRTSDTKRFYANRNNLLVLLKNCQHLLLILVPVQILLLAAEAVVTGIMVRRWSYLRTAYLDALADCWRLRQHIRAERRHLRALRRRGDFWMLRFFRLRLNRWSEFRRFKRFGWPKVDAR